MFSSIRWRIALPYALLILISMSALGLYVGQSLSAARRADLEAHLLAEARILAESAAPLLTSGDQAALEQTARHWSELIGARVTLIAADGRVLAESDVPAAYTENHADRPEVAAALASGQGVSQRFSQSLGKDMLYAAVRVEGEGGARGVARVGLTLEQSQASINRLRASTLAATLVAAGLAIALAVAIAARTAQPVHELTQAAQRLAAGDLSARLLPTTDDEIGQLTQTFNRMAAELQEKMRSLAEERSRLASVLDNMTDGVIITDSEGRVQLINPAAARLLGTTQQAAYQRPCAQVLRHHRLIELWQGCGAGDNVEVVEFERLGLFLRVTAMALAGSEPGGCMLVLQDLTQMRRLETVRRDFISNISHELRTPLASLKALVDTLRDGALDDPPAARHFINRIEVEVDALTQMVQELLELSRIESGQAPLRLRPTLVADIVLPPVERLQPQADRNELTVTVDLPADLPPVLADAERAQQVVTNLVHNAIKFTPRGGAVHVSATAVGDEVEISVSDTGIGIAAEDLPRIFERFYKADRARASGGTGLGLAIARHVVQGHGGRIWAESQQGRGSRFAFTLLRAGDLANHGQTGSENTP